MNDYSLCNRTESCRKKNWAKVTKPRVNTVTFNLHEDQKQARLNYGDNRSE